MKIILSHDVDHLLWSEHYLKDLFIPKLWIRTFLQRVKNQIDTKTAWNRCNIFKNKELHRLCDLVDYLKKENIRSTFFIGFGNGLNLSYSQSKAVEVARELKRNDFKVGVHGIAYDDLDSIKLERMRAYDILPADDLSGIRMHYLRMSTSTFKYLNSAGYSFDSTEYDVRDPYEVCPGLWSFPIGVMDTYALSPTHQNLDLAKEYTIERLNLAKSKNLEYFVINFHDIYFDKRAYGLYREWLIWLIDYLKNSGHVFTDFETALTDLRSSSN